MSEKLKNLRAQRAALVAESKNVFDKAGENFTAEHKKEIDEIHAKIDVVDAGIQALNKQLEHEANAPTIENAARTDAERLQISVDEATARRSAAQNALRTFLVAGPEHMTPEEKQLFRAVKGSADGQTKGTDAAGGYTVPTTLVAQLKEALKAYGGMRSVATVISTERGEDMSWPTVDETSNEGELVAEAASMNTVLDIAFGLKTLNAFKYSSKVVTASLELLQDSSLDIEAYVAKALGERLGRITEKHFTTGDGSGKPQGIIPAVSVGVTASSGGTTSQSYTNFVDLEHSIDPAYRQGARWMFNDAVLKNAKKLVDSQGRPLWRPGMGGGDPDNILGYGYTINQGMATPAANAKTIAFGRLSDYVIRDVLNIQFFRFADSAFTMNGLVGFLAFMRADGDFMGAGASVKVFQQAAS
jgi:HK97 family phage major capsid protein